MEQQMPASDGAAVAETVEVEAPLSVMEHAREFGPDRERAEPAVADLPANATPEQTAAHHSEQQRREASGEFKPGKVRHRAKSQQATAADAPRIQELTRRNKELQAQIDAGKAAPAPQPLAQATQVPGQAPRPPIQAATLQRPPQPLQRVSDPSDPEPKETDEKYGKSANGPLEYFQDWSRWNVRDEHRQVVARGEQQAAVMRRSMSWGQRVEAAMKDHADYADVAFQPVPWQNDSTIDKFIDQDDNGAKILYHLNSNPQDRDALMRMTEFQQTKFLALLSQRFDPASASPSSELAGKTGSVARQQVRFLPPKPPNPVRTEAQRTSGGPPPTDGSLSVMSHAKQFRRS